MNKGMGRREFLKFSMAAGALLAAGETTKGDLMAQETGKIIEVDKLTIWVLTDNYFDTLRPDSPITKRYRVTPGKSIHAEHGLAYFVETVVNGKANACMFDYGLDPIGVMNNISLLGLGRRESPGLHLEPRAFRSLHGGGGDPQAEPVPDRQGDPLLRGR